MNSEEFCRWLKGYFELSEADTLTPKQVKMIKKHLDLVYINVTDEPEEITVSKDPPIWTAPHNPNIIIKFDGKTLPAKDALTPAPARMLTDEQLSVLDQAFKANYPDDLVSMEDDDWNNYNVLRDEIERRKPKAKELPKNPRYNARPAGYRPGCSCQRKYC